MIMKTCPYCGAENYDQAQNCAHCQADLTGGSYAQSNSYDAQQQYGAQQYDSQQNYQYQQYPQYQQPAPTNVYNNISVDQIPYEYRPLSPWAYFGYQLLFAIPIVGLILLIVFSFSSSNINRRNFARSYFCVLLILAIIVGIIALTGGGMAVFSRISR